MPKPTGRKPLPREAMASLEKQIHEEETPARADLFPAKPGTVDFAVSAKFRYDAKIAELKAEMGPTLFERYCTGIFSCTFDQGTGVVDSVDGNTSGILMSMATTVHRLADAVTQAQQFLPKRDSYHKTIAGILNRLMQCALAMIPSNTADEKEKREEPPAPPAPAAPSIIVP